MKRTALFLLPWLVGLALLFAWSPAQAGPILYGLSTTIPVPASADNNVGGKLTAFDISWFDGTTQTYYFADRSNASVDIATATNNTFVGRVGGSGHLFVGRLPPPPAPANNDISGPDGVVVVNLPGQHTLWAGDGNSTVKGFDLTSKTCPPFCNFTQVAKSPIATGVAATDNRVDEMAFDPKDQRLLVANNAADPPFATLINTTNNTIAKKITFDGTNNTPMATDGIEQSAFDPGKGVFYLAIPKINGGGPGGISVIDPLTGNVTKTYDLGAAAFLGPGGACSPAGLAVVGTTGRLLIGCATAGGTSRAILFDPNGNLGAGKIVNTFPVNGADEVWFDPTTGRCFVAARNNAPGGPVLGIIDCLTGTFIQNVPTGAGGVAHSVAVDPVSGEVFMPLAAGDRFCPTPNGCIGVFALVPEPRAGEVLIRIAAAGVNRGGGRFERHRCRRSTS